MFRFFLYFILFLVLLLTTNKTPDADWRFGKRLVHPPLFLRRPFTEWSIEPNSLFSAGQIAQGKFFVSLFFIARLDVRAKIPHSFGVISQISHTPSRSYLFIYLFFFTSQRESLLFPAPATT